MKIITSLSAAALGLGLVAAPASAQLAGVPVNFAPVGSGVMVQGDFGRGLKEGINDVNSVAAMVTVGMPNFQIGAGASMFGLGEDDPLPKISFGVAAGYKLALGPDGPIGLSLHAGLGYLDIEGLKTMFVPVGPTITLRVPSTGMSVTPWISPQFRWVRLSNGGSISNSDFGVSGGVILGLPAGFGVQASIDYDNAGEAMTLGVGAHVKISSPGLGGM